MSNPYGIWIVEKLNYILKTKTADQQQTVFIKLLQKKAKITILFLLKNPKNNNVILVLSYWYLVFRLSKGLAINNILC